MKVFKSKKIKKKKKRLFMSFLFFFFFSYAFIYMYLSKNKSKSSVLSNNVDYIRFNVNNYIKSKLFKNVNEPVNLLNEKVKDAIYVPKKNKKVKKTGYIKNTTQDIPNNNDPIIYVYNTHESEKYNNYSVYDAAFLLSDKLNKEGIGTYFEEKSVTAFLSENNLKYYKSYQGSRKYLSEAKEKYNTIKYFFDIHRDSVGKSKSTITVNGKSYAKVLFVIGTDNPNNASNKNNAEKLNRIIDSKVNGISRGILSHGGKGYNGVYNQDISDNVFLIEVGGPDNTKEEVESTIDIIYISIKEYIGGMV